MKWMRVLLLAATLPVCASAADVTGTWKAVFLCPTEQRPKTVGDMTFDLEADGPLLRGTAHVGSWPGTGPISDGKIEGDRISFSVIGSGAWRSSSPQGDASGYPRLRFTGTIDGKVMTLKLIWDSIMIYGKESSPREWQVVGKKTSE